MGDYIIVATNEAESKIQSEIIDFEQLGKFIFRNQDGIFVYERTFCTEESFKKFRKDILKILNALKKEYKEIYGW